MNKFLKDWVNSLDDLKIELGDLDDNLLGDFFEEQKEKTKTSVDTLRKKVDEKYGDEADELRGKLDHLKLQLALGKAESKDAFEEQKSKLDHALRDARNNANNLSEKIGSEMGDEIHGLKQSMQAKMEVLRLQYALAKADAQDEMEDVRKDISHKVAALKAKAKAKADEADVDEKWDDFSDEMKDAFKHVKSAVRGLFS